MKLRFLAGVAAGYLFGTRAGRERYDQIVRSLQGVAESDAFAQARSELDKLRGRAAGSGSADSGLVSTPVIVGPGPGGPTGSPDTDVVVPDLESSGAATLPGESRGAVAEDTSARRIDPPKSN